MFPGEFDNTRTPLRGVITAQERMSSIQFDLSKSSPSKLMNQQCRHPRVQIVSRDEDAEFVECLDCREVFESSEFKDMAIEEKQDTDDEA